MSTPNTTLCTNSIVQPQKDTNNSELPSSSQNTSSSRLNSLLISTVRLTIQPADNDAAPVNNRSCSKCPEAFNRLDDLDAHFSTHTQTSRVAETSIAGGFYYS